MSRSGRPAPSGVARIGPGPAVAAKPEHMFPRPLRLAPLLTALACSSGSPLATSNDAAPEDAAPAPDGGSADQGPSADRGPAPDAGPAPDGGPSPDLRPGEDTAPLTAARSFLVQGTLVARSMSVPAPVPVPDRHDFLLRIDPAAKLMIVAGAGRAAGAPLKSGDGVSFESTAPLTAAVPAPTSTAACGAVELAYDRITATVRGDRVEGTGHGILRVVSGDQVFSYDASVTFSGGPDNVPPTVGSDLAGVDPLRGLFIPASEPLPPSSTARLVSPDGGTSADVVLAPLAQASAGGVITGFNKPVATALAYGASYEVVVGGPRTDLAGHGLVGRSRISTLAPPPLLAASNLGFEETATVVGGAGVVDATFLPPIAGQRSLFLVPSDFNGAFPGQFPPPASRRFTVRVATPAATTRLRLRARAVSGREMVIYGMGIAFVTAAPGGAINTAPALDWKGPLVRQPIPGTPPRDLFLGEIRDVELPLPAGHGAEVVLDVSVGFLGGGCGLLPPTLGLLIDDLKVE